MTSNRIHVVADPRTESPATASRGTDRPALSWRRAWRSGAGRLPSHRRGVLLLVVLSLLVLFSIIGVTFVLIAGQYRRTTRAEAASERYTADPQKQLDALAMDLFRGTTNVTSPIQGHGLLEDMNGTPSLTGVLSAQPQPAPTTNSANVSAPLIDLTVTSSGQDSLPVNPLSYMSYGYFNGQVLTMTSGPARGMSTRIVGSCLQTPGQQPNYPNGPLNLVLRVMAFDGISTTNFINQYNTGAYAGMAQRFVINGRAFSGTGFGYNTSVGQYFPRPSGSYTLLDAVDGNSFFFALQPNHKYFQANGLYATCTGPGGANEDYDAPDAQNMALAWQPIGVTNSQQIMPSFHRPDLVTWWQNTSTSPIAGAAMPPSQAWSNNTGHVQEKVILRPLQADHPLFSGSNTNFNPTTGPWDVDNDGDGIADSIWIDPGYPVQTAPDGKQFKMLAAYLVLDMDSRLNVNAHGNIAQTQTFVPDPNSNSNDPLYSGYSQGPYAFTTSSNNAGGGGTTGPSGGATVVQTNNVLTNEAQLMRGQGYGPAEINLGYLLNANGTAATSGATNPIFNGGVNGLQQYQQLLTGTYGSMYGEKYDGRYGELQVASGNPAPLPGYAGAMNSADDYLSSIKHFDLPYGPNGQSLFTALPGTSGSYYQNEAAGLTSYGTPSDFWGRMAVGLDFRGQPLYLFPNFSAVSLNQGSRPHTILDWETPNNPYALNLSRQAVRAAVQQQAIDNPYTAAELERILRRFDVDSYALPDRLRAVIEDVYLGGGVTSNANPALRQYLTTDSYDVASPSYQPPTELRQVSGQTGAAGTEPTQPDLVAAAAYEGATNTQNATLNVSIADLLRAKLTNKTYGMTTLAGAASKDAAIINAQLTMMLPPELLNGQMMDLNRPFGNGRDDNGNNVVDEPQEYATSSEGGWKSLFPGLNGSTVMFNIVNSMDFNNDTSSSGTSASLQKLASVTDTNGNVYSYSELYARQLYARHLYVLMMLLVDQGFVTLPGATAPATTGATWAYNATVTGIDWGATQETAITGPSGTMTTTGGQSWSEQQELTARRIAQWAINVVDFRDPDAIMTPFEYDVNPFDGWNVDGIVDTVETQTAGGNTNGGLGSNMTDPNGERRVVWGTEYPELLINETFAMHDRRVRDSPNDPNGKQRFDTTQVPPQETDNTMDQIRVPQGSLFVELYCPRPNSATSSPGSAPTQAGTNGSQAIFPGELYSYNTTYNQWYLNLGQMAPPSGGNQASPVWRLAISASNLQNGNNNNIATNPNNVAARMSAYPVTTTLDPPGDPYSCSVFNTNNKYNPGNYTGSLQIERFVWFANVAPGNMTTTGARTFYNQGIQAVNWQTANTTQNLQQGVFLAPGGYAVVGPRLVTPFGRQTSTSVTPTPPPPIAPQAIVLTPGSNNTSHNTAYTTLTSAPAARRRCNISRPPRPIRSIRPSGKTSSNRWRSCARAACRTTMEPAIIPRNTEPHGPMAPTPARRLETTPAVLA